MSEHCKANDKTSRFNPTMKNTMVLSDRCMKRLCRKIKHTFKENRLNLAFLFLYYVYVFLNDVKLHANHSPLNKLIFDKLTLTLLSVIILLQISGILITALSN